ncbi:MAG: UvrD-helicase domain-containing protein, partial [Desulfatiglandales bacterium]|nr:UvrD-helicase domain-containing protein [Desulfatiglandales bacterium]
EKALAVNEILVVTFTEAATEELKGRIRHRLRESVAAFSGEKTEDLFLSHLVKRHENPKTALRYLREALRAFDQAAIFTIHGFCRKILYENAFESGSLFDTELVTDQENLKREIVDDFWRKHFSDASPLFINYAINSKISSDSLLSLLANRVDQPNLKIVPQLEIPDSSPQEKAFQDCFEEVRKGWQSGKAEVGEILTTDEGLSRNKYGKSKIPVWIQAMGYYAASGDNNPALFRGFEKFSSREIESSVKKNHTPPVHPFFDLCERLMEKQDELRRVFERRLLAQKGELFHYVQKELRARKEEKNVQSFDDLLLKLYRALDKKGGEELAGALRVKYRAALIDEFQDTDPIQYAIFKKIFRSEKGILFYIGDPKQAIYGFRGADIFAYMEASRDAISQFTLAENWRSEPDLIHALNALFAHAAHPFVYDEISFQPSAPATRKNSEFLSMGKRFGPPLQWWFLDAGKMAASGKAITRPQAYELIPRAVAAEISLLLRPEGDNRAVLGKRPLREEDIAVLVRRNAEARLIQKALSAIHIPSVLYSTGNLFDSYEALEMERVLAGIAEPNNERLLKAALATEIIGVKGEELDRLLDAGWAKWLVKFRAFHDLWNERDFMRMLRYVFFEEDVLTRLMSLPDGERRNTNLLHLSEVLHQTSIERKLNMGGLLKWLSEQRDPGTPRLKEHQLRLESDENAVKVVTVHKSKGLEYPVVFCPFTWDGSRMKRPKDPFMFHSEADYMRLTLDLGSEEMDENRVLSEKEQ